MEAKFEIKNKSYFINGDEDQMKTKKEGFILHVIKYRFQRWSQACRFESITPFIVTHMHGFLELKSVACTHNIHVYSNVVTHAQCIT